MSKLEIKQNGDTFIFSEVENGNLTEDFLDFVSVLNKKFELKI